MCFPAGQAEGLRLNNKKTNAGCLNSPRYSSFISLLIALFFSELKLSELKVCIVEVLRGAAGSSAAGTGTCTGAGTGMCAGAGAVSAGTAYA